VVNLEGGECWTSRFEAGDVSQSESTVFKARDRP